MQDHSNTRKAWSSSCQCHLLDYLMEEALLYSMKNERNGKRAVRGKATRLVLEIFPIVLESQCFFHFRVEKYKATESDLASNRSDVRYQSCCDERVADDLPMNATTRRRRFCLKPRQSAAFGDTGDRLGCNLGSCG